MRKTPSIRPARLLGLLVCLLALGMTAAPSFANVFAAHLSAAGSEWNFGTQGNLTITYRLNQPATAVTIEVYRAADPGTVIKTSSGRKHIAGPLGQPNSSYTQTFIPCCLASVSA